MEGATVDAISEGRISVDATFQCKALPRTLSRPFGYGEIIVASNNSSVKVRVLLDSGSDKEVISVSLYNYLKQIASKQELAGCHTSLKSVNSFSKSQNAIAPAQVEGNCMIKMNFYGILISGCFLVIDSCEDMIVGIEAIRKFKLFDMIRILSTPATAAIHQEQGSSTSVHHIEEEEELRAFVSGLSPPDLELLSEAVHINTVDELSEEDEQLGKRRYPVTEAYTKNQRKINELLKRHAKLFATDWPQTENKEIMPMPIQLKEGILPRYSVPRRLSPTLEKFVREAVEELLRMGIVRPSESSYSSPVVLVRKKDGTFRFCVDYRELNLLTLPFPYPLPNIKEILARLAGRRYFTVVDLKSGFYLFSILEADRHKTAFATTFGLYEFNRLSMGLKNSPSYFQRGVNQMLSGLIGGVCMVYIDDLIIFGDTEEELLMNMDKVFARLSRHNARIKPEKCQFMLSEVHYLGFIVSGTGIRISPERTQAIAGLARPTSLKLLRGFVGVANYVRDFVPGFSTLIRPLTLAMSKKRTFAWTEATM